jgi:hypothetical protein
MDDGPGRVAAPMAEKSAEQTLEEFTDAVNMSADELERWLESDESRSVGQGGEGEESTGHQMGRRIVAIRRTKEKNLDDDDYAAMRKVVGYVHRHRSQEPTKEDLETSKWRYSLMNWGNDPLK